jgi:hypothetical protein
MEFIPGSFYELVVVEIREENENKYIYLSDGIRETYRVKPYDFQLEWEADLLPDKMKVFVCDVNLMNGLPYLIQARKEVLEHCYTEWGEEYPFKIMAIETDKNTGAIYYDLKDDFGIRHRYYPQPDEPKREVSDIFSLQVNGIDVKEGNNAFLKLNYIPDKEEKPITRQALPHTTEKEEESKFGREDNFTEFKSTIVFPAGGTEPDIDRQMQQILKIIAGFQNKEGGKLLIGINDSGNVCGINQDYPFLNTSQKDPYNNYQPNTDGFENKIRTAVHHSLGQLSNSKISFEFNSEEGLDYCCITINKVLRPVFLNETKLFQRAGNMTQILTGDEITWFIEDRMIQRNNLQNQHLNLAKQENAQQINEQEEAPATTSQPSFTKPTVHPEPAATQPKDSIWFFMTFYKSGDWSYQTKTVNSEEVIFEIPIMKSLKKERLLMVYANGCINMVCPYDIINPTRTNGKRKYKTKGKRYQNGWNTDSRIINMFTAHRQDLISVQSEDSSGNKYIKIHNVSAVSVHNSLHSAGNIVVNPKFHAIPIAVHHLASVYRNSMSSLIVKDYQTSTILGFNQNDRNIQSNLNALKKILGRLNKK